MSEKKGGIFITFEGTEGSGKSTLIRNLNSQLQQLGYATLHTREPGGNAVAEKIRTLLLESVMNPWTELLLYEAARAEHLHQTILPALKEGKIVLCDRFTDSSLAYQAHARGLPWKDVKLLNRLATQGLKPHLTVFLDLPPEIGLNRASDPNRFEAEGLDFQKKVRLGFLRARKDDPKRWVSLKVDGKTPEQLCDLTLKQFKTRFKNYMKDTRHASP